MAATIETKEEDARRVSLIVCGRVQDDCKRAVACPEVWQVAATVDTKEMNTQRVSIVIYNRIQDDGDKAVSTSKDLAQQRPKLKEASGGQSLFVKQ